MSSALDSAGICTEIDSFFESVSRGEVEIYNEFSLQHELGIRLRQALPAGFKLQFERPVDYFDIPRAEAVKREIDIAIFSADKTVKAAVELKYPRNGQYPEQMFSACVDLTFLEDLVRAGFAFGVFVIAVEDPLFYRGAADGMLYGAFRGGSTVSGCIRKPTGKRDTVIELAGTYSIDWRTAADLRYAVATVYPTSARGEHPA